VDLGLSSGVNELVLDIINSIIAVIGIIVAYKIGKIQSKDQARFQSYNDFMKILGDGKNQFPKATLKQRTLLEIEELLRWFYSFYASRSIVKVFGSKVVNDTIDNLLDEDDVLDETLLFQLNFIRIKLSDEHTRLAKQLNSKDKYNKFSEEISLKISSEISKPRWKFWK
jgi:hypothetical protein